MSVEIHAAMQNADDEYPIGFDKVEDDVAPGIVAVETGTTTGRIGTYRASSEYVTLAIDAEIAAGIGDDFIVREWRATAFHAFFEGGIQFVA